MFNANRDGQDRHSDDVGSKAAKEKPPSISGLAGSNGKLLAVLRRAL
jgi:hypothetical protein